MNPNICVHIRLFGNFSYCTTLLWSMAEISIFIIYCGLTRSPVFCRVGLAPVVSSFWVLINSYVVVGLVSAIYTLNVFEFALRQVNWSVQLVRRWIDAEFIKEIKWEFSIKIKEIEINITECYFYRVGIIKPG